MICKNCGAQIVDGSKFCTNCGKNPDEGNSQNTVSENIQAPSENEAVVSASEECVSRAATAVATEDPVSQDIPGAEFQTFEPALKPGKNKKPLIISIIAAVLIIILAGICFGKTVLYAVSPETYVGGIMKNTLDSMNKETVKIQENVFGFEVGPDKEFTMGLSGEYKERDDSFTGDAYLANVPKSDKLIFKANVKSEDFKGSFQGFWDDKNIGIMLPGSDNKYLTIPSKNFGKEVSESRGYMAKVWEDEDDELYDDLTKQDLSYSKFVSRLSGKDKVSKRVNKITVENFKALLEKSDISERKTVKYSFDKAKVNAKKIEISAESDDIFEFFIDTVDDIESDEAIRDEIGTSVLKNVVDELEDFEDEVKNTEIVIELIEYRNKIVSVSFITEGDDDSYYSNQTITISATDKDSILGGIRVEVLREKDGYDGWESTTETGYTSNWLKEDKNIVFDAYNDYEWKYDDEDDKDKTNQELSLTLDFDKEKWNLKVSDSYNGDKDTYKYNGKCSKKKGFTFEIDEKWEEETIDYSFDYDEWLEYELSDWLEEIYDDYRDDYLHYVYEELGDYYYEYDSYSQWYSQTGDMWDMADEYFEEWLFDYEEVFDRYEVYEEEAKVSEKDEASFKLVFTLKNKADFKIEKGEYENILDWKERAFENLFDDFSDEFYK